MKAILIGILSSIFFSVTFILNRSMELSGGSWLWSSSLRYLFMVPFLFLAVWRRGGILPLYQDIRGSLKTWLMWSLMGFGLFYAPITYAASSGPGWLVAGTWQFTIIAGTLLAPLFYHSIQTREGTAIVRQKIPLKGLLFSCLIFAGILAIQFEEADGVLSLHDFTAGILPVAIAAFAYPLGNRKMMEHCQGRLDTFQRVLGMTICSMPLWIILSAAALMTDGPPSGEQVFQSFLVGLSSGVIATVLFFFATELVRDDPSRLAGVEATQSTQIVFVIIGEILFLAEPIPNFKSMIGICIIILGMVLHSLSSRKKPDVEEKRIAYSAGAGK